jgi:dTDP-4-amino-4,6-dideoxy-D-galactose acyltransferase
MELCQVTHLEWDSKFFNCKVGRLDVAQGQSVSSANFDQSWDLIYLFFPNVSVSKSIGCDVGFHSEFAGEVSTMATNSNKAVSLLGEKASSCLLEMAHRASLESRFRNDPNISPKQCDLMFEIWLRRSLSGEIADEVLGLGAESKIEGFVALRKDAKKNAARISLLAVADDSQGRSIGRGLVTAAVNWARCNELTQIEVVTPGGNTAAKNFYLKCGFSLVSERAIRHYWKRR